MRVFEMMATWYVPISDWKRSVAQISAVVGCMLIGGPIAADELHPRAILGHQPQVNNLAFSPDGRTLASAAPGNKEPCVWLWDVATGRERAVLREQHEVFDLAFSPVGTMLAVACGHHDGRHRGHAALTIWDPASSKKLRILTDPGFNSTVSSCAFSPDGKTLAAGVHDRLSLWDTGTWNIRREIISQIPGWHKAIAFSPTGDTVATSVYYSDKKITLWDSATGQFRTALKGHKRSVSALAFSPDRKTLASLGDDRTVMIWYLFNGELTRTLKDSMGTIYRVAYSPDGNVLVGALSTGEVTVWDAHDYQVRGKFKAHDGSVGCVVFSPDGKLLATGGVDRKSESIKLWSVSDILTSNLRPSQREKSYPGIRNPAKKTDKPSHGTNGVSPETSE